MSPHLVPSTADLLALSKRMRALCYEVRLLEAHAEKGKKAIETVKVRQRAR